MDSLNRYLGGQMDHEQGAHNETAKLYANALDRFSTACFVSGVLVPFSALMLGQEYKVPIEAFYAGAGVWTTVGFGFHFLARGIISTVRD